VRRSQTTGRRLDPRLASLATCSRLSLFGRWQRGDFTAYLDIAFDAFGPQRVMIGSDWPVCTLSGDYLAVMSIVVDYLQRFSKDERKGILGGNCARFYGV
jgi:L-fuconolactonase